MGKKIVFIFEHEYEPIWRDGLWAALEILKKNFDIEKVNLKKTKHIPVADFYLAWGGFDSAPERTCRDLVGKKGLCIGGNAIPPTHQYKYDVLFYETEWYKPEIAGHPNAYHAFGINTQIYKKKRSEKLFDVLTVGSFSYWKRQEYVLNNPGIKMAIGEIQQGNPKESYSIIYNLLQGGCGVMGMIPPEELAKFYRAARKVHIACDLNGGGERAVLEAKACGTPVEVQGDNPKLLEVMEANGWDEKYYAKQLKKGIKSVI